MVTSKLRMLVFLGCVGLMIAACGGKEAVSAMDLEQGAFQDLDTEVQAIVKDPVKAEEVQALIEQFHQEFIVLRKAVEIQRLESRALNANYDATMEDFAAVVAANQEHMRAARERVTGAHLAIIAATTPEEWSELHKATTKAIDQLSASLRSY
jgi:hypothetical protein